MTYQELVSVRAGNTQVLLAALRKTRNVIVPDVEEAIDLTDVVEDFEVTDVVQNEIRTTEAEQFVLDMNKWIAEELT
jgi:hypothetical protein